MEQFGSYIQALDILSSQYMSESNPWAKDALKRAMERIEEQLAYEESLFAEYADSFFSNTH